MSASFWDKRSAVYDERVSVHDAQYEKTIEGIRSLLGSSDVVLDFACASGEMSLDIAPHVQRVHGIDIAAKMIELANRKARDRKVTNVSFEQTDAFDPSFESNSFSTIVALNIFHLLDDAPRVLLRLYGLLAPQGLLISETPCLGERGWLFRSFIGLARKLGLAPQIRSLTVNELETLVSRSNFEILESEIWDQKDAIQRIVARKV